MIISSCALRCLFLLTVSLMFQELFYLLDFLATAMDKPQAMSKKHFSRMLPKWTQSLSGRSDRKRAEALAELHNSLARGQFTSDQRKQMRRLVAFPQSAGDVAPTGQISRRPPGVVVIEGPASPISSPQSKFLLLKK